jgi:hypothetical protein
VFRANPCGSSIGRVYEPKVLTYPDLGVQTRALGSTRRAKKVKQEKARQSMHMANAAPILSSLAHVSMRTNNQWQLGEDQASSQASGPSGQASVGEGGSAAAHCEVSVNTFGATDQCCLDFYLGAISAHTCGTPSSSRRPWRQIQPPAPRSGTSLLLPSTVVGLPHFSSRLLRKCVIRAQHDQLFCCALLAGPTLANACPVQDGATSVC